MFDLTTEEGRLLLNVAMMAVGGNRFRSAAKIFAALERFRPGSPQVAAGQAVALISALRFEDCIAFLDENALKRNPDDPMLLCFKGMAYLRLDRQEDARGPLERAAAQSTDPAAAQMARGLLESC